MNGRLRDDIMKELGTRMGKRYGIVPRDTEGRNGHIRHEICIHKAGEAQAVAICLEEAVMRCIKEGLSPDELPGAILQMYLQEEVSQDISRGLYAPSILEGMVRIRLVNYRANSADLAGRPHRRFLDLAADYYLDMEAATGMDGAAIHVTGKMAGDWRITEERLYQEEKEFTALSDVSLSGETVDALEEIKRMAEGLRTGIPESVTNRNTDTTAGSIDLKI